mmetsp:Transcript_30049/g.70028  ORF Transcript_30049/g.70028 Transcript_30049/m.70028 type:complete len:230 (+) Transcript_30049:38-727(+)
MSNRKPHILKSHLGVERLQTSSMAEDDLQDAVILGSHCHHLCIAANAIHFNDSVVYANLFVWISLVPIRDEANAVEFVHKHRLAIGEININSQRLSMSFVQDDHVLGRLGSWSCGDWRLRQWRWRSKVFLVTAFRSRCSFGVHEHHAAQGSLVRLPYCFREVIICSHVGLRHTMIWIAGQTGLVLGRATTTGIPHLSVCCGGLRHLQHPESNDPISVANLCALQHHVQP